MQSLTTELPPAPAKAISSPRIAALDWTKGALVVCMVAYHAINYSAFRPFAFRFLAFLPPSFILIAGFLVGQVYTARYDLTTWKPFVRLATRGVKLLLLFTTLNIAYCMLLKRGFYDGAEEFISRSGAIFLSGNGRLGIFEVLLPIAYFLMISPGLLWLRARTSVSIGLCAVVIFALCLLLELSGKSLKNLALLSAGVIGMGLGLVPIQTIDRLATRWIPVLLLYLLYRVCSHVFGESYPVQMSAAAVSVLLLYCCALHFSSDSWLGRQMVLLGQYSLLGYLVQIAVLQGVVKVAGGRPEHLIHVLVVGVLTSVLTLLIVKVVKALRQRSRVADMAYRAVFA